MYFCCIFWEEGDLHMLFLCHLEGPVLIIISFFLWEKAWEKAWKVNLVLDQNAHLWQKQQFNAGHQSLPSRLKIISLLHPTWISDTEDLLSQEHNYWLSPLRNLERETNNKNRHFVKMVMKRFPPWVLRHSRESLELFEAWSSTGLVLIFLSLPSHSPWLINGRST